MEDMKKLGLKILFIAMILESICVFYNRSEWPFHSMDMFADMTKTALNEKIVLSTNDGLEIPIESKHRVPFGPWRFKMILQNKIMAGKPALDLYLSRFFQYQKRSNPEYLDLKEIRVYQCPPDKVCQLIGQGR
jgi:hypothetical protein